MKLLVSILLSFFLFGTQAVGDHCCDEEKSEVVKVENINCPYHQSKEDSHKDKEENNDFHQCEMLCCHAYIPETDIIQKTNKIVKIEFLTIPIMLVGMPQNIAFKLLRPPQFS